MRQPPTYTTWKITCHSSDHAETLRQWLSSRIDLDRVLTDTMQSAPTGVEQVRTVPHRLGDYFADIRTLPDSQADPASFRLVFHRRPEARAAIVEYIEVFYNTKRRHSSLGYVSPAEYERTE